MSITTAQVIRRGTEDGVREWLELLEEGKGQGSAHNGDHLAIINHALQVAVRANRPKITKLLLDQGAGDLAVCMNICRTLSRTG